ncbi:hypothetical protein E5K02_10175 [Hymenobacter metallicola]|uniref:Uncharacterized protein n=2 Tax=Hymenobacter metallicola TaxID=2563114 RepID=A0A4Z0QIH7_9BACT|nr:hypothetical protein E5K02_10175 [Hymenobacter metallicola]
MPAGTLVIAEKLRRNHWHKIQNRVVVVAVGKRLVAGRVKQNDLREQGVFLLYSDSHTTADPFLLPIASIRGLWLVEEFLERKQIR